MSGSNAGTGWPIVFFCVMCRRKPGWRERRIGSAVVCTGRTRPYNGGNRGARGLDTFHEYRCTTCGHVGWSRHVDIPRKPLQGVELPTDHNLLYAYVEAVFKKSKNTKWPNVRRVAKHFGWTEKRVENAVEGDPDARMHLTGYNGEDVKLGDLFVESLEAR